jgi:opacity protein-like surface antigen
MITNKLKNIFVSVLLLGMVLLYSIPADSQDLDALLEKQAKPESTFATSIFKSTRIVTGHSVERMKKKQLEFRISHRFDQLNSGAYNLYGLDYGKIHFALEYGLTDWLEVGAGRGSEDKTFDGFGKFSILRQSSGAKSVPVHLSYLISTEYISSNLNPKMTTTNSRMSYVHQILIARKFNESLSFQLTPTFIHRNQAPYETEKNNLFAIGTGARYKLSKRIALNVEYYYVHRSNTAAVPVTYYNPLGIGTDIETGGHVFQIMLTNSQFMREAGFIGKTTGSWSDAGIHLGFNVARVFSFIKK